MPPYVARRSSAACFVSDGGVEVWIAGMPSGVETVDYGGSLLRRKAVNHSDTRSGEGGTEDRA